MLRSSGDSSARLFLLVVVGVKGVRDSMALVLVGGRTLMTRCSKKEVNIAKLFGKLPN